MRSAQIRSIDAQFLVTVVSLIIVGSLQGWMTAEASLRLRKSGILLNISWVNSRTSLFDQPRILAKAKMAESCLALRRPLVSPAPLSPPFGRASPFREDASL